MCESVRGEWGEICPDCGERLPNPGPVASWKSQRPLDFPSGLSAGMGDRVRARRRLASTARMIATRRASAAAKGETW
jgi:hypothetical protein